MVAVYNPKIKVRTDGGWLDPLTGVTTPVEFPNATNVGVQAIPGWEPTSTVEGNINVFTAGTVLEDIDIINGSIILEAPDCTIRRCRILNGSILTTYSAVVYNHALVEDCTIELDPPGEYVPAATAFGTAGTLYRRCSLINVHEGWTTGGTNYTLANPDHPDGYAVRIYNCYCQLTGPSDCHEWHGDGIQTVDFGAGGVGLGGTPLIIRNSTWRSIDRYTDPPCIASSCMDAYFGQCQPVDFDRVLLSGATASFRGSAGGSVRNMFIEHDSWNFFPVSTDEDGWLRYTYWDCRTCTLDGDGQPDVMVNRVQYGYPGYGPLDDPDTPPWPS